MFVVRLSILCLALMSGLLFNADLKALTFNRAVTIPNGLLSNAFFSVNTSTLQVDEKLYYIDSENRLFVSNGSENSTVELTDHVLTPTFFNALGLVALNGVVYFFRDEADVFDGFASIDYFLWRTDGTQAGTHRAVDNEFTFGASSLRLLATEGQVFVSGVSTTGESGIFFNNDLLVFNGTLESIQTFEVEQISSVVDTVCAIDENNFYYIDGRSRARGITHVVDGELEVIDFPVGFRSDPSPFITNGDGHCIYEVRPENNGAIIQLISVNLSEGTTLLDLPIATDLSAGFIRNFSVKGNNYFNRIYSNPEIGTFPALSLFKFDAERNELIEMKLTDRVLIPFSRNAFIARVQTTENNIYIELGNNIDDVVYPVLIFDEELEFVKTIPLLDSGGIDTGNGVEAFLPRFLLDRRSFTINGDEFIFSDDNSQILEVSNEGVRGVLRSYDISAGTFIRNVGGTLKNTRFFVGTDIATNRVAIYQLNDRPTISERLIGHWSNNTYNDSGIDIRSTLDIDGQTRRLTLTFLTHLDGLPFWLTGTAAFSDGEFSIEIPMQFSTGPGFFQAGSTAEQVNIGTARITMLGCNEINVFFNLNAPLVPSAANFSRQFDTAFEALCNDDILFEQTGE